MAARTLQVGLEFDVFTHLATRPQSLSELARTLGLAERAAARLLRACAALGLVRMDNATYVNTPVVDKYLVRGRPTYIGSYVQLFDDLGYERWAHLSETLRQDRPLGGLDHPYHYLDDHVDEAASFLSAQHHGSASLGHALARRFDFTPFQCLLDLGGGAGTYTIEILRRYPQLQGVIFDFPQVCEIAAETVRQAGLTDRVRTVAGDYERDALTSLLAGPNGPDVVLWSGNLHASSPAQCARILRELRSILPAHGVVLVHDYLLDDAGPGPLIPALLALHMTLVSEHGQVYSGDELRTLFTQAGFARVETHPFLPGHSGLVVAHRSAPL